MTERKAKNSWLPDNPVFSAEQEAVRALIYRTKAGKPYNPQLRELDRKLGSRQYDARELAMLKAEVLGALPKFLREQPSAPTRKKLPYSWAS